jgi:hypothetical protein
VWAPHTKDEMTPIESQIISEMASTFTASGFKIQPVIENLLRSQHFYEAGAAISDDNFGGIIKSPLDLIVGTLRHFKISLPDMVADAEDFYEVTGSMIQSLNTMGMSFFEPYDVAGYEAYHQFPVYHRYWITPNSLTRRYEFIRSLVTMMDDEMFSINTYEYVQENFAAQAPNARDLVVALASYLYPVTDNLDFDDATQSALTTSRMNYFKNALLSGFDEAYWTTIWNGTSISDKRAALNNLFNAMLQSPEYQLA